MPVYFFDFSIPPSTSKHKESLEVEGEVLSKLYILIPGGHYALTGLRIMYGEQQLVPAVKDTYIKGNNVLYFFEPMLTLPHTPCLLTFEGYNNDEIYSHTFYVAVETKSEAEAKPLSVLQDFIFVLKKVMRIR
jgi:hypothetical protein